jgi:pimeloyl-ACP methyl ester carboxylesterase
VKDPSTSLADDVAVTKRALDEQPGQAVLVGHSQGGAVITEAGNHPKVVAALVYIAAFAPDGGESVNTLIAAPPPGAPVPPNLPPQTVSSFSTTTSSRRLITPPCVLSGGASGRESERRMPAGSGALPDRRALPAGDA